MNFFDEYRALPMGWRFIVAFDYLVIGMRLAEQWNGSPFKFIDNILVVIKNDKVETDDNLEEDGELKCRTISFNNDNNNNDKSNNNNNNNNTRNENFDPPINSAVLFRNQTIQKRSRKRYDCENSSIGKVIIDDDDAHLYSDLPSPNNNNNHNNNNNTPLNGIFFNSPTASASARSESGRNMNPFDDSRVTPPRSESPVFELANSPVRVRPPFSKRRSKSSAQRTKIRRYDCENSGIGKVLIDDDDVLRNETFPTPDSDRYLDDESFPIQRPFENGQNDEVFAKENLMYGEKNMPTSAPMMPALLVPSSASEEVRAMYQAAAKHEFDETKILDPSKVRTIEGQQFLLGEGIFGKVMPVFVDDVEFAAKIIAKESIHDVVSPAFKEAEVLLRQDHPNIVKMYHVTSVDWCPALLMEKADCDLARYLKRNVLSPSQIVDLFRQIVAGVAHLHSNDIVHCDLKPKNILVFEHPKTKKITVKLADFGGIVQKDSAGSERVQNICTSASYAAPEYHEANESKTKLCLNSSFDIFSLGVILLKLLAKTQYESSGTEGEEWKRKTLKEVIRERVTQFTKEGPTNPMKQSGACAVDIQNVKLDAHISEAIKDDEELSQEITHLMEICGNCLMMDESKRFQSADEILKQLAEPKKNLFGKNRN